MAIRERLVYAIDVVTDGANTGLKNFRSAVADAEGVTGKFKAGAASAFSTIQANAGALAVAGGAALVAFGAKAVQAFTEPALAAGKFSDATGLATEDASRWAEVANDVGVSTEAMTGGFVRLERAVASGSPAVKELGLSMSKTADGTDDVNATMLDAIDRLNRIQDPAKKAKLAAELFGRGFAEMSEIVLADADAIKARLEGVADAQVFDREEVEKARRFREAMDGLKDAAQRLMISVGEGLVPALSSAAENIESLMDAAEDTGLLKLLETAASIPTPLEQVSDATKKVAGWFGIGGDEAEEAAGKFNLYKETVEEIAASIGAVIQAEEDRKKAVDEARDALKRQAEITDVDRVLTEKLARAQDDAARAIERMRRAAQLSANALRDQRDAALESLNTMFDYEKAQIAAADAVDEYRAAVEAGEASLRELQGLQIATVESVNAQAQAFAQSKGAIEGSTASIHLQIAEFQRMQGVVPELAGQIQNYINALNAIPSVKSTQLVVTSSGSVTTKQTTNRFGRLVAGAEGAIVNQPTIALIGEAGPEAVVPLGQSPGNRPLPSGGVGGATFQITVHAGIGTDGAAVGKKIVEAIRQYERSNGSGWRS